MKNDKYDCESSIISKNKAEKIMQKFKRDIHIIMTSDKEKVEKVFNPQMNF